MFLEQIVSKTRADLEQRKLVVPLEEQQRLALAQSTPRDLLEALRAQSKSRIGLIAGDCNFCAHRTPFLPGFI